jgi:hypothetical protein
MKITDDMIVITQFVGVTLSVVCMIIGGSIYLYSYAWYPIAVDRPVAIAISKTFLISGIWLLISMQLVRVFMVFCLFLKAKEKVLSIVSFMILIILSLSLFA